MFSYEKTKHVREKYHHRLIKLLGFLPDLININEDGIPSIAGKISVSLLIKYFCPNSKVIFSQSIVSYSMQKVNDGVEISYAGISSVSDTKSALKVNKIINDYIYLDITFLGRYIPIISALGSDIWLLSRNFHISKQCDDLLPCTHETFIVDCGTRKNMDAHSIAEYCEKNNIRLPNHFIGQ